MGLREPIRALQDLLPPARRGACVLAYHLVEGGTGGVVDLPLQTFLTQLEVLQRAYRVVALHDVDPDGDPRQVVLTFDDAYANFYDVAWPELRARGLPATLYVPVGFVDGGPAPIRGTTATACTWEQLASMAAQGLDIGSHTVSHPDVGTLDAAGLDAEIAGSRTTLEERLGVPVRSFCYPRALVHARAEAVVARTYATATVGGGSRYTSRTDPHTIERVSIRSDHDLATFAAILRSRYWIEEGFADVVRQLRR
ncbi:MAG: polysaccharide deacetylase family protein [Myxococcales bacterium]|nr:polysaccharide deacetylase family protein [Myxococcales bacterium]